MPRRRKPARLIFHKKDNEYFIHHGPLRQRTGCRGAGSLETAEEALKNYLSAIGEDRPNAASPDRITVGELLRLYAEGRDGKVQSPESLAYSIRPLGEFFGDMKLSEITPQRVIEYEDFRGKKRFRDQLNRSTSAGRATVRHDLGRLVAAINFCMRKNTLTPRSIFRCRATTSPRIGGSTELSWPGYCVLHRAIYADI
jgi:hypothetical protein